VGKYLFVFINDIFDLFKIEVGKVEFCVEEFVVLVLLRELVFWRYLDRIYEITPSNDGLDPAALNTVANEMGLDVRAFASCVESGKHVAAIQKSSAEAIAAGAAGTPFSILMYGADEYVIQGSQTYDYMQGLLEILIASDSEASTSASAL
jgi:predicted DsbA family dithiol-disulfide isomerase